MRHAASHSHFAKFGQFVPAWLINCLPVRVARPLLAAWAAPIPGLKSPLDPADGSSSPDHKTIRQLLVDVSVIYQSDARTGIQRVVRSLLLQLLAAPPAGYRVCPVFAMRRQPYSHAADGFMTHPSHPQHHPFQSIKVQAGDLFLGLDLAAHLLPRHQPQLLRWKQLGVALHFMVYDLLPLNHPEWFNVKNSRNFRRWIRCIAIYADSAICISEFVKIELATWMDAKFGLPSCSLPASSIVLGADFEASAPSTSLPPNADFLLACLRNTPAVLMVGTLEPRKGYDQALAAFEHLWQKPGQAPLLVIVGRPGWKTDALQLTLRTHKQNGKRLFWLDDASDEFLACLYAACRGVLVASRAEGFGLPLIEAAHFGKPVLARDLAVFGEAKVANVQYFSSNLPHLLAESIEHWLKKGLTISATQPTLKKPLPTWQLASTQLLQALGLVRPSYTPTVKDHSKLSHRAEESTA